MEETAEKLGVNRSRKTLATSEIVLHVCDASKPFATADSDILQNCRGRNAILVLNKADLPRRLRLPDTPAVRDHVLVSALHGDGMDILRTKLVDLAYSGTVGSADVDVAINARHTASLQLAYKNLTETCLILEAAGPIEIVSQRLRMSLDCIGEIVGQTSTDDILDKIFSTFCIGK